MQNKTPVLKIKFMAGAFDKSFERSGLSDRKNFTKHVADMNKEASVLDRYDEFSELSLSPSDFASDGGEYGIPEIKQIHSGRERLLPHQILATKAFLKELRGFGLLADVVGSGKTFEACSVLSELAAKGKISTALIIVPSQVYDTWIDVLEVKFGLGKGVLKEMKDTLDEDMLSRCENGMFKPNSPIIVKTEDFVKWQPHAIDNVLFDVVVVDEAHGLCEEEGENAQALKLLSIMMSTKKRAKKTYCVLLSATPHSGILEQMFRLWYFIRCKGGNPEDFDVKNDAERTAAYRNEKEYYKMHICRGAATVKEFIDNVKLSEVTLNFGEKFDKYLEKKNITAFDSLLDGEKKRIIEDYLFENDEIRDKVIDNIASAYHNGVLRSIMIRQPNDRIRKGKRIENYFFFPATNKDKKLEIVGLNNEKIYFYPNEQEDKQIETFNGDYYSIESYVNSAKGNLTFRSAFAKLYFDNRILKAFGVTDKSFKKTNSLGFYWEQLRSGTAKKNAGNTLSNEDSHLTFIPVYNESIYSAKLERLKTLLTKHAKERVIIFFDYYVKKELRCHEQVLESLISDEKFKSRIIIGNSANKDKTISKFNDKEDAVLVVTDNAFTEGANLQTSSVIINFQVTPNPLAMEQRIGRIFRLGQKNDVTVYSLADMTDLEGYVLIYFNRIGLMTSNDGDAAIIAGSNTDNMVTIRCSACGNVKLMSKDDFDAYIKNDSDEIYCSDNEVCRLESMRGIKMLEINSNEEKCDNCGNVIMRQNSDDGGQFHCLSTSDYGSGVMCNKGEKGDRSLYCRKICAIAHCERFILGAMKGKCPALKYYQENPSASDADLYELCMTCENAELCADKCKIGCFEDAIKGCSTCRYATCSPKPHVITFDDKWHADCPICKTNGKLKPVVARTFETYIRSAFDYEQDGGKSFCINLSKECEKVAEIKEILSNDKADNNG